ncbi:hypothetical protein Hdeb2414_s1097g00981951 [Helianthus debilis subsp. tardiflorus]
MIWVFYLVIAFYDLCGGPGAAAPGSGVPGAAAPGGVQGAEPLAGVELPGQLGNFFFLLNCCTKNASEKLNFHKLAHFEDSNS